MGKWTNEKQLRVRGKIVSAIEKEGGRLEGGPKNSPGKWLVANVDELEKSGSNISQILKYMERDGFITLTRTPGGYIDTISLPSTNGKHPVKEEPPEETKVDGPFEEVHDEAAIELQGLAGLAARVDYAETRALEAMEVAEDARKVIEFLRSPPPELDKAAPVKAALEESQRQVEKLRRELAQKNGTIERAVSRQRKAEAQATEAERVAAALGKNLTTAINMATKSGAKVRDLLNETQRKEIDRLMREIPSQTKN